MIVPVLRHARRRFAADEELQRRFGSAESLAYWVWLMTTGWQQDDELRRLLPCPPHALMARTAGAHSTDDTYHEGGFADAGSVFERLVEGGFSFAPGARLLDFGCGAGRLLRPLSRLAEDLELHGTDVDVGAIAWARRNLPWAHLEDIAPFPPLPYPDRHFDAAFAFAVFSQLAEPLQRAWIAELARVLRPGAPLVVTTHGRHCADRFAADAVPLFPFPPAAVMAADLPLLAERGWLFYPYPAGTERSLPAALHAAGLHGVAFVTREHVASRWLDTFALRAHHEAPRGFLDEIVLQRRERPLQA